MRTLRKIIQKRGSADIVYVDESGFEHETYRPHGWTKRGKKVYAERTGSRKTRTNVIAAHRGKDFLAPFMFEGTTKTELVNQWTEKMLFKELRPASTIIWDNAAFHSKKALQELADREGHFLLFLPPYSPDFNPIEQDWAIIKKRRIASPHIPLDQLITNYGNYSE